MNTNNFAQVTNFSAGSDKLALTSLYLSSVNIPGINFSNPEIGGRSGSRLNIQGDTLQYNTLSFELLLDEDFLIFHEFMDKVFFSVNQISGSFASREFDFWVQINNSNGNKLFTMNFNNCRIESISDIQLDSQSEETELKVSVEIKYDYYELIKNVVPTLRV